MGIFTAGGTKLRLALGAGVVALGLAVSGAAAPARADDGWRTNHGYPMQSERGRLARERAIAHERALERAREARRRAWWERHHAPVHPAPHAPWFYR